MANRRLHVLHLTLGADAGGLSRYIADLSLAMHRQGHRITVAGDTGAWQWLFDSMPFPYIKIPLKGGPVSFWKSVRTLRAYLRENPVDLIHTHYRRATLLGRRLQRIRTHGGAERSADSRPAAHKTPLLYTLHLSHLSLAFPRNLFTDFGDHTHVAAPEARDWLIRDAGVPPQRISLIPHGVDTQRYALADEPTKAAARVSLGLRPDDVVALYVGRLDYPKNEQWMLDLAVAARESRRLPNLKVLLVGEGPHERMLRERIDLENLSGRVKLLGYQDPLAAYQAADAILLPSSREGFSLVCAEAMSVGVPALRTRTSGTHSLIVENVTGRSVPIERGAFISAALDFLSDRPALSRMGQSAAQLIRDKYPFDEQLRRTGELYERLIAGDDGMRLGKSE